MPAYQKERTICSSLPESESGKFENSQSKTKPVSNVPERSASSPMKYMGTTKKRISQIAPGASSQ